MTSFAAGLRAGGPTRTCLRGLWVTFLSPFGLEVAGTCGAEWIGIDVQHGDLELADVAPLARVSPVPVLVRLGSHDEAQLARALDAGVDGVIVPAVESAVQAVSAHRRPDDQQNRVGAGFVARGGQYQPAVARMISLVLGSYRTT